MSYNSLHKCLINNKLWATLSFILLGWYLSPLFYDTFYVPVFDNLDSIVVYFKILAKSGKIFAPNDAIIPNMMNGLPRPSYPGEFNVILWLYYFFEPKTAYIINELAIHIIAFFSMFVFLKTYIVKANKYYGQVPIYVGSLYFALLPYWSGAGASIALLPLVTYVLFNIKNGKSTKWDWLLLVILPLYSSFIFLYMFYIVLAGIYMIYDTVQHKKLNKSFFFALFLMGTMFLLSEYRLLYGLFFDNHFISHRVEFNIFYNEPLWECYRLSLVKFLLGHKPHAMILSDYILPTILVALVLSFFNRRLSAKDSLLILVLFSSSLWVDLWNIVLIHKFTIPGIIFLSLLIYYKNKYYSIVYSKKISLLLIFIIILVLISSAAMYKGLYWLVDIIPLLKTLNMRIFFVDPFVYGILFSLSSIIFLRKLKFALLLVIVILIMQVHYSINESFYKLKSIAGYSTFENYYATNIFTRIKKKIDLSNNPRFISFGLEPAVSLYNGLYTVDGYSVNYPLSYKHKFKKIFEGNYDKKGVIQNYNNWGSKVYLMTIPSQLQYFKRGLEVSSLRFNTKALCNLNTSFMLTPYFLKNPQSKYLSLQYKLKGEKDSWDIFVYKIDCSLSNAYPKEGKRKIQ